MYLMIRIAAMAFGIISTAAASASRSINRLTESTEFEGLQTFECVPEPLEGIQPPGRHARKKSVSRILSGGCGEQGQR
jgi:hypothetical protein